MTAASAIALIMGATAHANTAHMKFEICHFSGHTADDNPPPGYPMADHIISSPAINADAQLCKERGGKVIKVACPALKGHLTAAHDQIDAFCDFSRGTNE